MNIILLHSHYDADHLANVIEEMKSLGAPTIKAVWAECYGAWCALEGCHRIRAAKELGLVPVIEEIEYREEETVAGVGCQIKEDCTIAEVVDDAWRSEMITFDE